MSLVSLDTSAGVKLAIVKDESRALLEWLSLAASDLVSSSLLVAEMSRACNPHGPEAAGAARGVIDRINLFEVDRSILESASRLSPATMRTLDTIHLATALQQVQFLTGVVTYDQRLAAACREHGVPVVSPGADL